MEPNIEFSDFLPRPIRNWENQEDYRIRTVEEFEHLYPYDIVNTGNYWAWEFLRRSKRYQFDCYRYFNWLNFNEYKLYIREMIGTTNQISLKCSSLYNKDPLIDAIFSEDMFLRGMAKNDLAHILLIKYRLLESGGRFQNYTSDAPPLLIDRNKVGVPHFRQSNEKFITALKESEILFKVDMTKDLNYQLEFIRDTVNYYGEKYKPKTPRKVDDSLYLNYIRVLDAVASGAHKNEIAKTLCPGKLDNHEYNANKNINNWLMAAKELADGGYIKLLGAL